MRNCFVIQPFDRGPYDERFEDIFEPAVKAAGLSAYRVDRDPSVSIPIDDIEKGIAASALCLAEITTDNPNVWFELGYAIASQKEVVLVCGDMRTSKLRLIFNTAPLLLIKQILLVISQISRRRLQVESRPSSSRKKRWMLLPAFPP